jgi:hypothetical protein
MCTSDWKNTSLITCLNQTCGTSPGFHGIPDHWHNSLITLNSKLPAQSSLESQPSCLDSSSDCSIDSIRQIRTLSICVIDQHGDCQSTPALDLTCFCDSFMYGRDCRRSCGLSWQRKPSGCSEAQRRVRQGFSHMKTQSIRLNEILTMLILS